MIYDEHAIANGAITSTKPAESFMKRVTLLDNEADNALGWNHDGVHAEFTIFEPTIFSDINTAFVSIFVTPFGAEYECFVDDITASFPGPFFFVGCNIPPDDENSHLTFHRYDPSAQVTWISSCENLMDANYGI
jgi:hypothetical protein